MEIKEGEESVRLSRAAPAAVFTQPLVPHVAAPPAGGAPESHGRDDAQDDILEGHAVKSPMVGTFFSAPKPGAKPFAEVGTQVEIGDTLCVIEAMKIFNQIEADKAGVVIKVFKENGEPVEYGEPLFIID
jgi:acetyl-CoA carboxylase biotin carboxyl carrier protein